jgi:hypothetical protein
MQSVQFYTRKECDLCHAALAVVKRVQQKIPFRLDVIDIDSNAELNALYGAVIPVVRSNNQDLARSFVDEKKLLEAIRNTTHLG